MPHRMHYVNPGSSHFRGNKLDVDSINLDESKLSPFMEEDILQNYVMNFEDLHKIYNFDFEQEYKNISSKINLNTTKREIINFILP